MDFYKYREGILARKDRDMYERIGIDLPDLDGEFTDQEEAFAGGYIEAARSVPGLKYLAEFFAAGGRAHVALMLGIHADFASILYATSVDGSNRLTESQDKALGKFINIATGRGDIGKFNRYFEAASIPFLAPRFTVSRFQYLVSEPIKAVTGWGHEGTAVRKIIAKEYARSIAGSIALATLTQLSLKFLKGLHDDEEEDSFPELDPRSSSFFKPRIGGTSIDLLGGVGQSTTLLARALSGQSKTSRTGKVYDLRGPNKSKFYDMEDVLNDFRKYKFSPAFSAAWSTATLETPGGTQLTPSNYVPVMTNELFTPIPAIDIYKSLKDDLGIPATIAVNALMELGSGMQTFSDDDGKLKAEPSPWAITEQP